MARTWFRHDASMRRDPAVRTLVHEFGVAGYAAWCALLELHCDSDGGIAILRQDLADELLIPADALDIGAWLARAAELKLVTVTEKANNVLKIVARRFAKKNPAFDTKEAAAERQRRSRRRRSHESHSDNGVTSQSCHTPTDVDVQDVDVHNEQDVDVQRAGAREAQPKAGVSHETPTPEPATPSANGTAADWRAELAAKGALKIRGGEPTAIGQALGESS